MDVLAVDDDPLQRKWLGHILQQAGYTVTTAADGLAALELLRAQGYQLLVTDWDMPGLDGVELCQTLRARDFGRYVYVILVTSRADPIERSVASAAGVDDYLTKPVRPEELLLRVHAGRLKLELATRSSTIFALAQLAEARDPTMGEHLQRIRDYCRLLAQHLRQHGGGAEPIDDEFVHLIYETSPLHDIGKLAIPDSVLLKPARVDAREFELLKTHTVQGAATLEAAFDRFPITQFFQMAREIVLSHHERFDGSGYPRHLAGTQIPLAGRIVALVDTYDALTSRRVYRDATSHTTARDVILAGAGTAFDPRLVRLFVELEEQFRAIREQAPSSLSVAPATPTVAPPVSSGPAWTTPVAAV